MSDVRMFRWVEHDTPIIKYILVVNGDVTAEFNCITGLWQYGGGYWFPIGPEWQEISFTE